MSLVWSFLYIFGAIVVIWLLRSIYQQRSLPRGPIPVPYFGNLISLAENTHIRLEKLAQHYGPIFTVWFGSQPVVMVNDYHIALDVFSKNGLKFAHRPNFISKVLTKGQTRLPFMDYSSQFIRNKEICRSSCQVDQSFLDACLRSMSKELGDRMEAMLSANDFDPAEDIEICITKLMSKIVYGNETGAKFQDINLAGNKKLLSLPNSTNQFILLRLLRIKEYLKYKGFIKQRDRICRSLFAESLKSHDKSTVASMIVDVLNERTKSIDLMESETLCSDLFVFGIEDLCAAFRWILLYFITWPEIQRKVQEELDTQWVHNQDEDFCSVEEAGKIPYLQAAILETLRLSSLNPLSALHVTTESVTLRGFKLSRNTCVCVNLNSIHHNSKYWEAPYEFRPSRFLDGTSGGKKLRDIERIKGFLPFGAGVRKCMADDLSLKILSTLMANLLYRYYFDVSPWNLKTGLSPNTTRFVLYPDSYMVRVTKR